MLTRNADMIGRLNVLLDLASKVIDELDSAGVSELQGNLYWAVYGGKLDLKADSSFDLAATRDGMRAAQEGIRGQLHPLRHAPPMSPGTLFDCYPSFDLSRQTVRLFSDDEGFFTRYESRDFPTMAYGALCFLVERLKLKPGDFLSCDYERCKRVFVPMRKPHAQAKQHFCSQRCANIVSARNSRTNNPQRERERLHKKYKSKVRKSYPNAPVARKPRKKP